MVLKAQIKHQLSRQWTSFPVFMGRQKKNSYGQRLKRIFFIVPLCFYVAWLWSNYFLDCSTTLGGGGKYPFGVPLLAPRPTTRTAPKFCLHQLLNQQSTTSQLSPLIPSPLLFLNKRTLICIITTVLCLRIKLYLKILYYLEIPS